MICNAKLNIACVFCRTQNVESMKRVTPVNARQSVVGVFRNPMYTTGSQEQLNVPQREAEN